LLLIHRVELKHIQKLIDITKTYLVANPPCGVETSEKGNFIFNPYALLIHRVELKPQTNFTGLAEGNRVANPPCGVETCNLCFSLM